MKSALLSGGARGGSGGGGSAAPGASPGGAVRRVHIFSHAINLHETDKSV